MPLRRWVALQAGIALRRRPSPSCQGQRWPQDAGQRGLRRRSPAITASWNVRLASVSWHMKKSCLGSYGLLRIYCSILFQVCEQAGCALRLCCPGSVQVELSTVGAMLHGPESVWGLESRSKLYRVKVIICSLSSIAHRTRPNVQVAHHLECTIH